MKVAVITPYYKEALSLLQRCHASVKAQTHPNVRHFMVADGFPNPEVAGWDCEHIVVPNCGDYGDTPRGIGAAIASVQGYDAICLLDADCWFDPDHVEELLATIRRYGVMVATCPRNLYRLNGTFMRVDVESDGAGFNDTNCYLFTPPTFPLLRSWLFKTKKQAMFGDRELWKLIKQTKVSVGRSIKATLNYTTGFAAHYIGIGEEPLLNAKVFVKVNGEDTTVSWAAVKEHERRQAKLKMVSEMKPTVKLPLKNARMFQIYYKPEQIYQLDPTLTPFDNTANEHPELREWHCWKQIHGSRLVEGIDYWGAVSPKFGEKTKLTGHQFLQFVHDNPGKDVYYMCPSWINTSAKSFNVWADGEKYHPGLIALANEILHRLGYNIDVASLDMTTYFFSNFFIANKRFWEEYMKFVDALLTLCQEDQVLHGKVLGKGRSNYYQDPTAPMFPFLVERFTPTFVMLNGFSSISFSLISRSIGE